MIRLKELRKRKGLSQAQFAKEIGVAQNTISNWENRIREIDNETLIRLADFFDVSVDYILGRANINIDTYKSKNEESLPPSEQELLDKYRSLDDSGKTKADEYLSDLAKLQGIADKEQLPAALRSLPPFEDIYEEQENKVVRTDILGDDGYERHAAFGGGVWKEKKDGIN